MLLRGLTMKVIFSRVKQELEFFLDLINSEYDKDIPYYLIKINDDYHYEMYLKIERTEKGWSYDYMNHQVYYAGSKISSEQLVELIELLKKDKRTWKEEFSLIKQNKSKELVNKYLGIEVDYTLGAEISDDEENIDIKEFSEKSIDLGSDEKDEYEFINQWINFSPFTFMNKHQFKPFLNDIKECYEKHRWTILTNQEAMKGFLDALPDIFEDIEKTGDKEFLKWLIEEAKKCIKEYKAEKDNEFQKFLGAHYDLLKKIEA